LKESRPSELPPPEPDDEDTGTSFDEDWAKDILLMIKKEIIKNENSFFTLITFF